MCALQKTCIFPDPHIETILRSSIIKLVVLGNYEGVVTIADNLALYPPMNMPRHVIWYPSVIPTQLQARFPTLSGVENIRAFSLSRLNGIADVITTNEIADYVRIDLCFTRAGASA